MHLLSPRTYISTAMLCISLLGSASYAADEDRSVSTSLRGLDLTTAAGLKAAHHRIFVAAQKACDQSDPYNARATMDYDRCSQDAIADAMPALRAQIAAASMKAQFAAK